LRFDAVSLVPARDGFSSFSSASTGYDSLKTESNVHSEGLWFQGAHIEFVLQKPRGRSSRATNRNDATASSSVKTATTQEIKNKFNHNLDFMTSYRNEL
jgi:hypothetical protein